MCMLIISVNSKGSENINSVSGFCGKNGDNVKWYYTSNDSLLQITGNGEMIDFNGNCGWSKYPIKNVIIQDGITNIGAHSFDGKSIISVKIPKTVTHINDYAFGYCKNLSNVDLPNSITFLGIGAFYGCSNLMKISINNVDTIKANAFCDCGELDIELPKSLVYVGERAFRNTKIKSIQLYSSIRYIGFQSFSECDADVITFNDVQSGVSFGRFCFQSNNFSEITIPSTISTIDFGMFNCCSKLKKVKFLGEGISLCDYAFSYCKELECLEISGLKYFYVSCENVGALTGCSKLGLLSFGKTIYHFPENVEYDEFIIDEGVEKIASFACNKFVKIKKIKFPSTILSVESRAFNEAENIETIDISNCKELAIGSYAFFKSGIKNISPFDRIRLIDVGSFMGCANLEEIDLFRALDKTANLVRIPELCFSDCTNLRKINLVSSCMINKKAFQNCKNLKDINSSNISSFSSQCFSGCSAIDSLDFSYLTQKEFYIDAFTGCSNLRAIVMPVFRPAIYGDQVIDELGVPSDINIYIPGFRMNEYSMGYIGEFFVGSNLIPIWVNLSGNCGEKGDNVKWSFNSKEQKLYITGKGRMTSISDKEYNKYREEVLSCKIDEEVTNIADSLFCNSKLSKIVIGDNITEIGNFTFYNCPFSYDFQLTMGKNVKKIGNNAFDGSSLFSIKLNESLDSIGSRAFADTKIKEISIPNKISYLGEGLFVGCSSLKTIYFPTEFGREKKTTKNKIPSYFCWDCESLQDIYIPNIESPTVGTHAFKIWNNPPTVHVPYGSLQSYKTSIYGPKYAEYYCYVSCKNGGDGTGKIKMKDGTEVEEYEYYHLPGESFYAQFIPDSSSILSNIDVITNNMIKDVINENFINIEKLENSKTILPHFSLKSFVLNIESNYGGNAHLLGNGISAAASFNVKYGDSIHVTIIPYEDYYIKEIKINNVIFKSNIHDREEFDIKIDCDNLIEITYSKTIEDHTEAVFSEKSYIDVFSIDGVNKQNHASKDNLRNLSKGIYIMRSKNKIRKYVIE